MINCLQHSEIDFEKYDRCIRESTYPLIYAESRFLNITAGKEWKVLVMGDYKAVMPVPFGRLKRSFWRKSVVQPYFCQQLGVFSTKPMSNELFNLFWEEFLDHKPLVYHFNHENLTFIQDRPYVKVRTNFVLLLNCTYKEIFSGYSSTKRQCIRKAQNWNLSVGTSQNIAQFITFHKENLPKKEPYKILNKRKQLMEMLIKENSGRIYTVCHENELLAMAFFVMYRSRVYYFASASTDLGRKYFAMHFLIDTIIRESAGTYRFFDFEGSELPGVASFMKSFGPEKFNFAELNYL